MRSGPTSSMERATRSSPPASTTLSRCKWSVPSTVTIPRQVRTESSSLHFSSDRTSDPDSGSQILQPIKITTHESRASESSTSHLKSVVTRSTILYSSTHLVVFPNHFYTLFPLSSHSFYTLFTLLFYHFYLYYSVQVSVKVILSDIVRLSRATAEEEIW